MKDLYTTIDTFESIGNVR